MLRENLPGLQLVEEHQLTHLFAYDPRHNPKRRRASVPRSDFVLFDGVRVVAVLDAKYRDLWENPLPREMLYQLALYALGRNDGPRCAVILYPTLNSVAEDQVIRLREPLSGRGRAEVVLRPVELMRLEGTLAAPARERELFARALVGAA